MSRARAQNLENVAIERELDAILVTDLVDLRYLTAFTGSNGAALVGPPSAGGGDAIRRFATDFRYRTQVAELFDGLWDVAIATDLLATLCGTLGDQGVTRLGFDDARLSVREHARLARLAGDDVELVAAGGALAELRARKEAGEIVKLRAAAALADAALLEVVGRGLAGRTERDVGLDLEMTMRRMGAEGASFAPIVAAGPHGALPHAVPRDVVIAPGTLCVVDWGAQLDGYASDCTRTFATSEEISPEDRAVYALVLRAQETALAAIAPGPLGKEIDAIARTIIDDGGHGEHFGHGLGHGVGLEVHEGPRLSKQGDVALEAGHVVTVEPGVYVPGVVGVRIEDLVLVTPDGFEVLNGLPKHLQTAPAAA